jgi:tight adherence protein B
MELVLILASLMMIMLAGAIMLWRAAANQRRRSAGAAFINERVPLSTAFSSAAALANSMPRQERGAPAAWDRLLARAGKKSTGLFYLGLLSPTILLPLFCGLLISGLAAIVLFVAIVVLQCFRLWMAIDKRRRRMVLQLPGLLEGMVRLITVGNSMGAAFQSASSSIDMPLKEVVDRVANANRTGKDLDVALAQAAQHYALKELQLVAAVVSIALRFGGRSDQVLDRMAGFMRDVEQARAELVALSTEVRLSAWILALLPFGIACFIVVFNSILFTRMWDDPLGFKLLIAAVCLQAFGSWWLYRMAKSI